LFRCWALRPSPAATSFLLILAASHLCGQASNPAAADAGSELVRQAIYIAQEPSIARTYEPTETPAKSDPPASAKDSRVPLAVASRRSPRLPDFNRDIYYRNKTEFSLETGYLPINIPFVFDILVNSPYTQWPLHYTMVPTIASLRWHLDGVGGPSVLRGNTDFTFSGSFTAIPRGAETRYAAFEFGIRRNFIQPRWRVVPYFDSRGGIGNIDARGPLGVEYAQGQDLTFTLKMGSGARYNFNPRYSVSAGLLYMHVSNLYLSEPKYENFGINVYGPELGFNVRLGKEKRHLVH
jgi:hypothetical protein